jgi:hypothetical protein
MDGQWLLGVLALIVAVDYAVTLRGGRDMRHALTSDLRR